MEAQDIVKAFEITGLRPMRGSLRKDDRACAIGALYQLHRVDDRDDLGNKLGVSSALLLGVMSGFDGKSNKCAEPETCTFCTNPDFKKGIKIGEEAWKLVSSL